jgi:hypothetical protein
VIAPMSPGPSSVVRPSTDSVPRRDLANNEPRRPSTPLLCDLFPDPHLPSPSSEGTTVTKALPIGQLGENHYRKVIVGRQRWRWPSHGMQVGTTPKLFRMSAIENLGQNSATMIHCLISEQIVQILNQIDHLPVSSFLQRNQQLTEPEIGLSQTAAGSKELIS